LVHGHCHPCSHTACILSQPVVCVEFCTAPPARTTGEQETGRCPGTADLAPPVPSAHIQTIILANLCRESHLRDALESGFDVLVVRDETAGPGRAATAGTQFNFGLIASAAMTTD
jgi:hypothetical protein